MERTIKVLSDSLHGISSLGVSSSSLIDAVKVQVHGQNTPLKHLASTRSNGRRVTINVFDQLTTTAVAKACQDAGFEAYVFSKDSVVVTLPSLSGEYRNEMKLKIKKLGEETKVSIRNIRKQFKQGLKGLSKSDRQKEEKMIQKETDKHIMFVNEIVAEKTSYVMS